MKEMLLKMILRRGAKRISLGKTGALAAVASLLAGLLVPWARSQGFDLPEGTEEMLTEKLVALFALIAAYGIRMAQDRASGAEAQK